MSAFLLILIANSLISLIALVGIATLYLQEKLFKKILTGLVALSAGALMGGAFLHLIPEAVEEVGSSPTFLIVLLGFVFFFLIEKVFHWRHCHEGKCPVHTFAYLNLFGDTVHNFLDGLTIAAAFLVNPSLGMATTFAVALHEIPQEIGDFGVLVYAGIDKKKALFLNFVTALTAILGGLVGFFLANSIVSLTPSLLSFASGGFIYISASDLIPEIKKETNQRKSTINFGVFVLGLALMYLLTLAGR